MGRQRQGGGKRRNPQHQVEYSSPLPILVPLQPKNSAPKSSFWNLFGYFQTSRAVFENPGCVGILDVPSKSIWIVNARDTRVLWTRGFFGKGNLSRSEPTWLIRRQNEVSGDTTGMTAEEVTALRRTEREKFKADRAKAIADAQASAEAAFEAKRAFPNLSSDSKPQAIPAPTATSRPTRPSQSTVATAISYAKIAEASTPSPPTVPGPKITPADPEPTNQTLESRTQTQKPSLEPDERTPEVQDMEHLQLTFQETFFLAWALGCLRVLDPETDSYLTIRQLLDKCLEAHLPFNPPDLTRRFDNPFLVQYAVYHHYRSLGWVVRGGIKFCVDYLLYKRGPVFDHAEFALVVCPVYEDPDDETTSPFNLPNVKPMDWAWFSTINRVNSQVKKTLVLTYVTIPSVRRMSAASISLDSPDCLSEYSVREVVIKRFVPARMRD